MVARLRPSHECVPVPHPVYVDAEAVARREYRESITLLRKPFHVLYYLVIVLWEVFVRVIREHQLALFFIFVAIGTRLYVVDREFVNYLEVEAVAEKVFIWVGLGFLSSFGMGFGLHTFVLFLAPAIYHVAAIHPTATIQEVWGEVWWWSFAWGTGTAIGELPPYFAARTARLAGKRIAEIDEMEGFTREEKPSLIGRLQAQIIRRLDHFQFWHIMLFASVPNPLFDFAGIACGHTLKPFWMFFGATFIGKAVFKSSFQTLVVISANRWFDEIARSLTNFAALVGLGVDFSALLATYKKNLSHEGPQITFSVFTRAFENAEPPGVKDLIVLAVILGFVFSMIQTAVQAHLAEKEELAIARRLQAKIDAARKEDD